MTTSFKDCNPIITVSDIQEAKNFYIDVIGFDLDFDSGDVIGLVNSNVLILLIDQESENVRQPPGSSNISFLTDEVDSLFSRCASAKVDVIERPADRPYGQRDFAIRDRDGNVLNFGCPTSG
jgi:catechol 2,3-dioxygenase-like lactoylglutathione lyase family enzyme